MGEQLDMRQPKPTLTWWSDVDEIDLDNDGAPATSLLTQETLVLETKNPHHLKGVRVS